MSYLPIRNHLAGLRTSYQPVEVHVEGLRESLKDPYGHGNPKEEAIAFLDAQVREAVEKEILLEEEQRRLYREQKQRELVNRQRLLEDYLQRQNAKSAS